MVPMTNDVPLTSAEQIYQMASKWQGFCLLHSTPWSILWRGKLRPLFCTYEVQISYYAFRVPVLGILPLARADGRLIRPYVEVLSPILNPRAKDAIPHKFLNFLRPQFPRLCLHTAEEWNHSMAIADTIVPWTIEWLVAYEGWRATGEWLAGGHGTERRAA
jgi:hypothetical protein